MLWLHVSVSLFRTLPLFMLELFFFVLCILVKTLVKVVKRPGRLIYWKINLLALKLQWYYHGGFINHRTELMGYSRYRLHPGCWKISVLLYLNSMIFFLWILITIWRFRLKLKSLQSRIEGVMANFPTELIQPTCQPYVLHSHQMSVPVWGTMTEFEQVFSDAIQCQGRGWNRILVSGGESPCPMYRRDLGLWLVVWGFVQWGLGHHG